ncbi:MAG: HD domain-containing protein, partial [Spirochaetaceae bacterium]|nr:HD domain-containing protein [Spirochaetaceae bacterium]
VHYNAGMDEKYKRAASFASAPAYGVAHILAALGFDADCVAAGLLCRTAFDGEQLARLERALGGDVYALTLGSARVASLSSTDKTISDAEHIRKMLFAMVNDIRVIFIKLADKLDMLRTISMNGNGNGAADAGNAPDSRRAVRAVAQECLDIYAPLAGRLGIQQIKDELEDLALKQLNHDAFLQIKEIVAANKDEREAFLSGVKATVLREAERSGITVQAHTRAKHFYSIYQKMRKLGKSGDELFDLLGIRIICRSEEQCYTLIGICHRLWKPIDGRFKDYIAMPKNNGYKSLHTTVMAEGNLLEIQIRTAEMHETAEFGVASHWLYKKGMTAEVVRVADLSIINRLKEWQSKEWNTQRAEEGGHEGASAGEERDFLAEIKKELLKDSIFVFTPMGKVIELPQNATAIDFAYAIHTDIGDHCNLAKANGKAVPLGAPLQNTQVVEIQTVVNAHPSRNWLSLVKTAKARGKIRAWLALHEEHGTVEAAKEPHTEKPRPPKKKVSAEPRHLLTVRVADEKNMLIRFAKCCSPQPPQPIVGFVSRGRGIIIHRAECKSLPHIAEFEERRIDAEWESTLQGAQLDPRFAK